MEGLLAGSVGGRLLPGRAGVVVLDRTHPLLRLFDRSGTLLAVALPRGGGPEEANSALSVAVSDDNRVLVLTGLGLREFRVADGELLFLRYHPRSPDVPAMFAVESGCAGDWFVYTTPFLLPGPERVPVLARGSYDEATGRLLWSVWREEDAAPGDVAYGVVQHMHSDGESVVVRHRHHPTAPILRFGCGEGEVVEVLRETEELREGEVMRPMGGDVNAMVLRYPLILHGGFSRSAGSLLETETLHERLEDGSIRRTTFFSLTEDGARARVRVPGDWQIHDGRDGEILLYSHRPEPHYRVLDSQAVRRIVREEGR